MASITENNGEKSMADDQADERPEDARPEREEKEVSYRSPGPGEVAREKAGFFHVYKSGQGYWTRMGTAGGAALVILLIANFFYTYLPTWSDTLHAHPRVLIGIVVGLVAVLGLLTFWFTNKPGNVDFLIATDSEMKKVNWTSRRELIGSTKIVVIFVLLITGILFLIDIEFGQTFYYLGVLHSAPVSWGVAVDRLQPSDIAATEVLHPVTKAVLVPARAQIDGALAAVRASGVASVDCVVSASKWFLFHAIGLIVVGVPIFFGVFRKSERR